MNPPTKEKRRKRRTKQKEKGKKSSAVLVCVCHSGDLYQADDGGDPAVDLFISSRVTCLALFSSRVRHQTHFHNL
jgi:hypothetical protein